VLTEESQEIRSAASSFVETLHVAVKIDEDNKKAAGPDIYALDRLPMDVKSWYLHPPRIQALTIPLKIASNSSSGQILSSSSQQWRPGRST